MLKCGVTARLANEIDANKEDPNTAVTLWALESGWGSESPQTPVITGPTSQQK